MRGVGDRMKVKMVRRNEKRKSMRERGEKNSGYFTVTRCKSDCGAFSLRSPPIQPSKKVVPPCVYVCVGGSAVSLSLKQMQKSCN